MTEIDMAGPFVAPAAPVSTSRTRVLTAAGLISGPILIAVGTALDPAGGPPAEAYLARTTGAAGLYLTSGMLLMTGMLLLLGTSVCIVRTAGQRRGLLRVGGVLVAVWGALAAVGVALGYTAGWVAIGLRGAQEAQRVQVFDAITNSPWTTIAAPVGGLAWAAAMIILGISLVRGDAGRRWAGLLVLLSPIVSVLGGPVLRAPLLAGSAFVLLAVGLVSFTLQPRTRR